MNTHAYFLMALLERMSEDAYLFVQSLPRSESPKHMLKEETTQTVIFNPRVCNDVDLDAGKWIRIHAPWYETEI